MVHSRLFRFHADVDKLTKVLIKGGDGNILSDGGGGEQTIDKMCLGSLVAVQSVEVDRHLTDLDARTGGEAPGAEVKSTRTRSPSSHFTDFSERHPFSLIACEHALE